MRLNHSRSFLSDLRVTENRFDGSYQADVIGPVVFSFVQCQHGVMVLFPAAKRALCTVAAGSYASPRFRKFGKVHSPWRAASECLPLGMAASGFVQTG